MDFDKIFEDYIDEGCRYIWEAVSIILGMAASIAITPFVLMGRLWKLITKR